MAPRRPGSHGDKGRHGAGGSRFPPAGENRVRGTMFFLICIYIAIFTERYKYQAEKMEKNDVSYGRIQSAEDLGRLVRAHRKDKGLTLERVSGLGNLSTRFLSEFERGKETAEIGKVLKALRTLGLDIIVQPRGGATPSAPGPYPTKTRSGKP